MQLLKGSPEYPSRHVQIDTWLCTLHSAFTPHVPGQGSVHFSLIHALSLGQSEFMVHSGLQFGGLPIYVSIHEQEGDPPISRH